MILSATEGQPSQSGPPLSEWDHSNEQLAQVVDSLNGVAQILIAVNGQKAPKTKPSARPTTAFDNVRQRMIEERHKRTVARVLGKARKGS